MDIIKVFDLNKMISLSSWLAGSTLVSSAKNRRRIEKQAGFLAS